jgi:hypothetical protein
VAHAEAVPAPTAKTPIAAVLPGSDPAASPRPPEAPRSRTPLLVGAAAVVVALVVGSLVVIVSAGGDDEPTRTSAETADDESSDAGDGQDEGGGQGAGDDADAADAEEASAAPTTTQAAPAPLSATVTSVTAERESVFLRCTNAYVDYFAGNLVDGDLNTGWGAGADDGTGQSITLDLGRSMQLTRIGLTPGYLKVGPRADQDCASVDAFGFNRFVTSVRYTFDDGTTLDQTFDRAAQMQWIDVPDQETSTVTITILGTDRPAGADDDTILSDVQLEGRAAGT